MADDPTAEEPTATDDVETDGGAAEPEDREAALMRRFRESASGVNRRLVGALATTPTDQARSIADELAGLERPDEWDTYGEGGAVKQLEEQVAGLLGKPAAVMFPSGVMAQQSVLRVWTDRRQSKRVAIPELSHLLQYELDGPARLNGFAYEWLTRGPRVPVAKDLEAIPGVLGAALLELPLRDGAYQLPSWDELAAFSAACRERGVPLHFDAARLWESQPHLGRPLAEIAGLADTAYVSLYKGLGGLAGAVVVGADDVVAEIRQWRTRHGGTLYTMMPQAVAGLRGLRTQLPRMAEYHDRARELAALLVERGLRVFPDPPHTNAFRVYAERDHLDVTERIAQAREDDKLGVSPPWSAADVPGWSWTEFVVADATMGWSAVDAADTFARVVLG